ncbi:hypothetical protein KEM56_005581 [Ascosphaera pollenicola]|nr:hypothetical protein KEM56_005581 [Ascosphaera pollenicola]
MSVEGKEYLAREGLYNQQRLPTPVSNGPGPLFGGFSQYPSQDGDTQPASQLSNFDCSVDGVEGEAEKGVWGYLTPLGRTGNSRLVLKDRQPQDASTKHWSRPGYLVGRHPECDYTLDGTAVKTSNRHFVIFRENRLGRIVAVLEDLSGNGTFVNGRLVGKNNCCELSHRDAVSCVKDATFIFEYPRSALASTRFQISYHLAERLGHGQYGSVHVAIEKQTGARYAVKHLVNIPSSQSLVNIVQQKREIATPSSISKTRTRPLRVPIMMEVETARHVGWPKFRLPDSENAWPVTCLNFVQRTTSQGADEISNGSDVLGRVLLTRDGVRDMNWPGELRMKLEDEDAIRD